MKSEGALLRLGLPLLDREWVDADLVLIADEQPFDRLAVAGLPPWAADLPQDLVQILLALAHDGGFLPLPANIDAQAKPVDDDQLDRVVHCHGHLLALFLPAAVLASLPAPSELVDGHLDEVEAIHHVANTQGLPLQSREGLRQGEDDEANHVEDGERDSSFLVGKAVDDHEEVGGRDRGREAAVYCDT